MFRKRKKREQRKGAVTVEFAVVAPIFLSIMLGVHEASKMYNTQNHLATAAREGARIAAMDREGVLQDGQTTNEKVVSDVKSFLENNGISTDNIEVNITDDEDADVDFDLDDPDNEYELFAVRIELPYGNSYVPGVEGTYLGSKVVFRNARSTIVQ